MNKTWLWTTLLAGGLLLPTGGASIDTTGCTVFTAKATAVGGYYAWGARELWEETNGIPGLQRGSSGCEDRPSLPADTCYTHSEDRKLVMCAAAATMNAL